MPRYIPEYIPALAESIAYLLAGDGSSTECVSV